jgi:hypothetical protein
MVNFLLCRFAMSTRYSPSEVFKTPETVELGLHFSAGVIAL